MNAITLNIPAKMLPFWTEARRHKIARGGRGGAKSHSIAQLLLVKGMERPIRWLCAREVQKSIRDSVHKLLSDKITELALGAHYEVLRDVIRGRNGTEFLFAGLRDHTIDSIKSYEGCDGCWIEEARSVTERSATVLVPTIRKPDSELWWSYNPDQSDDYIHVMANRGDPDTLVVDIGWQDNPWFPAALDAERRKLQALNDDLYRHVWEGECRSVAGLLFKRHWFKFYDTKPEHLSVYMASDYAVSQDEGDWTEHGVAGLDEHGDLYLLDWWSGQESPERWIEAAANLVRRHKPAMWFEEKGVILRAVDAAIAKRLRERDIWVHREPLPSAGNKAERALGFAARASAGAVWLPKADWAERLVNQLCSFTGEDGRTDDMVDVCSLLARGLDKMANARAPVNTEPDPIIPFTRRHIESIDRDAQQQADDRKRYYR